MTAYVMCVVAASSDSDGGTVPSIVLNSSIHQSRSSSRRSRAVASVNARRFIDLFEELSNFVENAVCENFS